jgi:hypothetical protein
MRSRGNGRDRQDESGPVAIQQWLKSYTLNLRRQRFGRPVMEVPG